MAGNEMIECGKCHAIKKSTEFFKKKDGTYPPYCKKCLTEFIENTDRSTFDWILKEYNIPYVDRVWKGLYNKKMKKDHRVGPASIMGTYIRTMNLQQWRKWSYEDTDALEGMAREEEEARAARAALDNPQAVKELAELQQMLDRGEIDEAEFNTRNPLAHMTTNAESDLEFATPDELNEDEIKGQLNEEEIQMLRLKWGTAYKPSQWIRMEDTYNRYSNQYDLTVDREEALRQICKLVVKMDEALDIGDLNGYKALSMAYDTLRKSAKFTEAQKEDVSNIDCIGQLVALCEREGGIIPHLPSPDKYPRDKIDFTIKDLKEYNRSLAVDELNLGDIIESYVKKLEMAEEEKQKELDERIAAAERELAEEEEFEAIEQQNYKAHLDTGIEEEANMLFSKYERGE